MRATTETSFITLLLCAAAFLTTASSVKIKGRSNPLNIDYGAAPSPEDGPPLSAGALRDPAYLPAEIGGIVGAYILILGVIGTGVLLVGRRSRRRALSLARDFENSKDIELTEQNRFTFVQQYASPLSPGAYSTHQRNFSYPSPPKEEVSSYVYPPSAQPDYVSPQQQPNAYVFPPNRSPISPVGQDPHVDSRVVEADRDHMQRTLEDMYAHVMKQEEAKAAGVILTDSPLPRQLQPQTSPQRNTLSKSRSIPQNIDVRSDKTQSRTSSMISSLVSPRQKKGVRGLRISSPIPTPLQSTFPPGYASDEEPLSPRLYTPAAPPPVPTDQQPYTHSRHNSNTSQSNQHNRNYSNSYTDPSPTSPAQSVASQLAAYPRQGNNSHFRQQPSHASMQSTTSTATQNTLPSNPRPSNPLSSNPTGSARLTPKPTALRLSPASPVASPASATSQITNSTPTTRALPFRAFDPPAGLGSPSFSPYGSSTQVKTTVLERTTPLSPGLRTPWTAGAVPYSPYQPQTPLIPITPRLVTRQERKAREKAEKKMPVLEMIKSEDEIWDSGY